MGLDCQKCKGALRVSRGCDRDSPIPDKWNIDGWKFQRCPNVIVSKASFKYIEAYNMFRNGFLPNEGGWLDQSAKLIKAFQIIEKELSQMAREENKS